MDIIEELQNRFGPDGITPQATRDAIPTLWIAPDLVPGVLGYLKGQAERPYRMLYDLTAIDERVRVHRDGQPAGDFTLVYHLLSFERNEDLRLKVALGEDRLAAKSVISLWPSANWYEREAWDMFGIAFEGHPRLSRILMPPHWQGHPLRKDHPARATDMEPFTLSEEKEELEEQALRFRPEEWGIAKSVDGKEVLFLNLGPQHPGTHGPFRIVVELDGEEIVDAFLDIGFHHRGAEKMGERQSWHTYIPYTDRVDYLGGIMNNFAYLLAVEQLAGIEVPDRGKLIRIMMAELFRISNHLVWYGTFVMDVGAMSPVFFTFNDRERLFAIVKAVCGARMHPNWFRIGGVAEDLPRGWEGLVRDFLAYLPRRLKEYDRMVLKNRLFKARTQGIGAITLEEAVEWGVTGPNLRACDFEWDFRKKRPYGGYDQLEFDVPTAERGDCYARALVRVEEIRQSLRIIGQCLDHMPDGPYKSRHPLATPPLKGRTMHDIETLIDHFLGVSWGPVVPAGECFHAIEATKGSNGYYLISDGGVIPYRVRIRTPSFAHVQMLPLMSRGFMIPDLMAIIGSIDFVMGDVDR
ncbi:MAG: NADH-quinone oxidoreductase subunit C/D [Desulfobacteraceae bacterium]|nr:NADH-quinone oxidoreductase subunit C/D [Desulfobacteraceae bacterium]